MRHALLCLALASACASATQTTAPVDDSSLRRRAGIALETWDYATCTRLYAQLLAHTGDDNTRDRAYLCACHAHAFRTAAELYDRIPAGGRRDAMREICMREGFDPD